MTSARPLAYVVVVRHYFDRVNGNSYFGGEVFVTEDSTRAIIPFQYGHGEITYLRAAEVALKTSKGCMTYENAQVVVVPVSRQRDAKLAS